MGAHRRRHPRRLRQTAVVRIAVDVRSLQPHPPGGIGRSLRNVLPLVAREAEVHLLTDLAKTPVRLGLPEHGLRTPWPGRAAGWLQWSAPAWLSSFTGGIFHCPFYGLPYRQPVPMVVSLHDLSFEHWPAWFTLAQREAFRRQARHAARTARVVITGAEQVRADIVHSYGVEPARVLVSPHGVDPAFAPDLDASAVLERLQVTRPYVVALGGAARRRSDVALAAWQRVTGAGPLVMVGPDPVPSLPGVVAAGVLADADWAALLSGATAFLYPTAYEGFGLPALEALGSGTPVVCARVGALPEVLGEAAAWSESLAAEDLADALVALLGDPARAAELRTAGLRKAAAAPGWEVAAAVHLEAYRRAAA